MFKIKTIFSIFLVGIFVSSAFCNELNAYFNEDIISEETIEDIPEEVIEETPETIIEEIPEEESESEEPEGILDKETVEEESSRDTDIEVFEETLSENSIGDGEEGLPSKYIPEYYGSIQYQGGNADCNLYSMLESMGMYGIKHGLLDNTLTPKGFFEVIFEDSACGYPEDLTRQEQLALAKLNYQHSGANKSYVLEDESYLFAGYGLNKINYESKTGINRNVVHSLGKLELDTQTKITNERIKKAILEYAGVSYVYYSWDEGSNIQKRYNYEGLSETYYGFYYNKFGIGKNGHALCLIGWDDNFPKELFKDSLGNTPENDGAFLTKNSHGYLNWASYEIPNGYNYTVYPVEDVNKHKYVSYNVYVESPGVVTI